MYSDIEFGSPDETGRVAFGVQSWLTWTPVMTWTLVLPWTKPPLSLNDRGQTPGARAGKSAIVARIRSDVATLAKAARIPACASIHVRMHYQPPDRIHRDPDNLIASQKPCVDGLVDAGVVADDTPTYLDWSRPVIHDPAPDRKPAMWLVITETGA